jgi:von Willebrand factor type A domain
MLYQCVMCSIVYDEAGKVGSIPASDGVCHDNACLGGGIAGLLIPFQGQSSNSNTNNTTNSSNVHHNSEPRYRELGLCVFLMDASGSMGDPAFTNQQKAVLNHGTHQANSGTEREGNMSRREMIALYAAQAVFSLERLGNKDDAYVACVMYDDEPHAIFYKTISQIMQEYGDGRTFAQSLLDKMKSFNGGTNINKALQTAHAMVEQFKCGELSALGQYSPISQPVTHLFDVRTGTKLGTSRIINNENIRILIYTDGEHLPQYGVLRSPFETATPDPLIGIFIGEAGSQGCRELRSVIKRCPEHGEEQFLIVDQPQKLAKLHGIFRMATGASGFCEKCLITNQMVAR